MLNYGRLMTSTCLTLVLGAVLLMLSLTTAVAAASPLLFNNDDDEYYAPTVVLDPRWQLTTDTYDVPFTDYQVCKHQLYPFF